MLRDRSPVETESLAMPADHGVGLDNYEDFFPARPEPEERNPEATIERRESGLRSCLSVRRKLLAKGELDDHLFIVASKEGETTAKKRPREIEQSLHRGETLRDLPAEYESDSRLRSGVRSPVGRTER